MGIHTSRNFETYDAAKLTKVSALKLRASQVANEVGYVLKEDIKKHPIKMLPMMIPTPIVGLSTAVFAGIMGYTLIKQSASAHVRQRFKDAASRPIDMDAHQHALRECPKTGKVTASSAAIAKKTYMGVKMHGNHLLEQSIDQLPENSAKRVIKKTHQKLSRYPMPTIYTAPCCEATRFVRNHFNGDAFKSNARKQWNGAVFALASLSNFGQADIAMHLSTRDQEMYIQEYATQEL